MKPFYFSCSLRSQTPPSTPLCFALASLAFSRRWIERLSTVYYWPTPPSQKWFCLLAAVTLIRNLRSLSHLFGQPFYTFLSLAYGEKDLGVVSVYMLRLTLSHMMLTLVPLQLHLTDLSLPIPAILSSSNLGLQCCLASLHIQKYFTVNVKLSNTCYSAYLWESHMVY